MRTAVHKVGVLPDRAVLVGDAVWDMLAARRAGVRSIGVLTGGYGRDELLSAGAVAMYDHVGDLVANVDQSPIYLGDRTSQLDTPAQAERVSP